MKRSQLGLITKNVFTGILPNRCVLCGLQSDLGYCRQCYLLLPRIVHKCHQCGRSLPKSSPNPHQCGLCLNQPPPYQSSFIPFFYSPPISNAIQNLKFHKDIAVGTALAEAFIEALDSPWSNVSEFPEVLTPVPLHKKRLKERGFNQSLYLAEKIGSKLGIPVNPDILLRIKNTEPQSNLPERQRNKNMRGAFEVTKPILKYEHVALIDDVVTSGNTVRAAAKLLKFSSVQTISVWAIAKTKF